MFARVVLALLMVCSAATSVLAQAGPAKISTFTAVIPTPDERARQWLVLLDDKNYAQSWSQASKSFQNRQTLDAWAKQVSALRASLGAVTSRDLNSIDMTRSNFAIIRYDTEFAHKAVVETITLAFQNGGWAVDDYTVK